MVLLFLRQTKTTELANAFVPEATILFAISVRIGHVPTTEISLLQLLLEGMLPNPFEAVPASLISLCLNA